jgi:glycosyltransferase involved in cell wall biosynthesis
MPRMKANRQLEPSSSADLRILILNWRCPRNPRAGGAESLTFEIARRLVAMGHTVEWFSASFPGAAPVEEMDGIRIVRAGRQWTVHWHAFKRYRRRLRGQFDVVIDEVNTMPFFTPLWAGIPTCMLIFQLAREVWWYESPFPISAVGYVTEPLYLRGYRHTPVFTISKSTEQDLRGLGFKASITIVPIGIEKVVDQSRPKADTPTFLYVGRLAPSKRIAHILRAVALFREATGTGTLQLVGSGSAGYQRTLVGLAQRLGIEANVVFVGRASSEEKHRLMAEAHALLMTSVREGWGLVVTEANACGTPAIVYDVPGLRDSVVDESTGIVVAPGPQNLSAAMVRLTTDSVLYARLVTEGQRWSAAFSFEAAASVVARALEGNLVA